MKNNFPKFSHGETIIIKAKPKSSKSELVWDKENKKIVAFLHSVPENNKANEELIRLFRKNLKLKIEIISGIKGRDKKIKIL